MKVIGLLHQKTTYYKDVVEDEFKQIYDNILDTINYNTYFYEYAYECYNVTFMNITDSILSGMGNANLRSKCILRPNYLWTKCFV